MALTVRTLTNVGDPITWQDGTPAVGEEITFQLADENGDILDGWDDTSGERVVSKVSTVTLNATGEFSINLWPNARATVAPVYYRCDFFSTGTPPVLGIIPDAVGDYLWIDFMQAAIPVPPEV